MKTHTVSLINAIALIAMSLWGYFSSASPSLTALIPVAAGLIILLLNKGLKKENKTISHIVVLLTFLILIALIKPLLGAINRGDELGILRVSIMLLTSSFAMIFFVKSFVDARKANDKS